MSQKSPREKILEHTNPNNRTATRWMWVCTTLISLAILGVWGYGFTTQLSFFNWSNSSEAKLIKNTKEEWSFFFSQQPTSTTDVTAEVKAALQHIIASSTPAAVSSNTTTTVASSTPATTTPF